MTGLRELERQRHSLAEIRNIMNSMKMLAYMETRKLARYLEVQHAVVDSIEAVAADLLSFHPGILPRVDAAVSVFILFGTERGFCGDFNPALPRHLANHLQASSAGSPILIAIGHKLHSLLEGDQRIVAMIDGASVIEETEFLLKQVVDELSRQQEKHGLLSVHCLYHGGEEGIVTQQVFPSFERFLDRPPKFSHAPLLHQSPTDFLLELTSHYLFAALHEILYTSLMAENQHRITHLEATVRHLDHQSAELTRRGNAMRQEEIIEEIEVILLSAASLGEGPP